MALVIGGVQRGTQICIGDNDLLTIEDVIAPDKVLASFGDRELLITDLERTVLQDAVFVQVGIPRKNDSRKSTRLAFEAPREIRIRERKMADVGTSTVPSN